MTYVCCELTHRSQEDLNEILRKLGLQTRDEFHVTILYSKRRVHQKNEIIYFPKKELFPQNLEIWTTTDGPTLVMNIDSRWCRDQHSFWRKKGGTHDYLSYKPHITLAYNFESEIPIWLKHYDIKDLVLETDLMRIEDINKL